MTVTVGQKGTAARVGLADLGEAAEFLRLSRTALYSLMDKGELKFVKLGRSRRVPWTSLEELAAHGTCGRVDRC
jgi:excisionase family DNA binding protein